MRKIFLLFCLISFSGIAQEFPKDWLGSYKGEMLIANLGRPTDTIPVEFEIVTLEKDSIWSYKMTFYSERYGTITKDYKIAATAKDNHQNYLLDENNGIVMEITLMDGTFYGMYEVMDMMFINTMRYKEGTIYYDLFAAPMANPLVTSTKEEDSEDLGDDEAKTESIEATSYGPTLHQTALFIRTQ